MIRKTVEGYPYEEFIFCHCGCKKTRPKYDKWYGKRYYIKGHVWIGRKASNESKRKQSEIRKIIFTGKNNPFYGKHHSEKTKQKHSGKLNHQWKGDDVGYKCLHKWIRRHFPKPDKCHLCKDKEPKEIACITGILNREFKNWAWFCRSCHRRFDNIGIKAWITKRNKKKG